MSEGSELFNTNLRGILYAMMELQNGVDGDLVLNHLGQNVPDYYRTRETLLGIVRYLASKLSHIRPDEARVAGILEELIRNQKI
jgi:hypothetical protein